MQRYYVIVKNSKDSDRPSEILRKNLGLGMRDIYRSFQGQDIYKTTHISIYTVNTPEGYGRKLRTAIDKIAEEGIEVLLVIKER